jgi:hypothetical protein
MTSGPQRAAPIKLLITGQTAGIPAGFDSAIIGVPAEGWYLTIAGARTFVAQLAARDLRAVSEAAAADVSVILHHADWVITSDPAEVTTLGLMHDCAVCRAGVDQATAYLRDNPGREIAVGQLWWARRRKENPR